MENRRGVAKVLNKYTAVLLARVTLDAIINFLALSDKTNVSRKAR